jgi:hypothetical protein
MQGQIREHIRGQISLPSIRMETISVKIRNHGRDFVEIPIIQISSGFMSGKCGS